MTDAGWIQPGSRVYIAGGYGMVGSALYRLLSEQCGATVIRHRRQEIDLTDPRAVDACLSSQSIDVMIVAAATVGGILANNTRPAEFIQNNLMIAANLIDGSYRHGIDKLLYLGSSCIYPKHAEQPMVEEALLTGHLEPTNEPYAVSKIAGIKLCESYNRQFGMDCRCAMPTNLYGQGDNYDLKGSHVIPALMRRFHDAVQQRLPEVVVWGSGQVRREFLLVDDLANGCLALMQASSNAINALTSEQCRHLNIGSGVDVTIAELAALVAETVGFKGQIQYDSSKPDGAPRKLLDISKIRSLGWSPVHSLRDGLAATYQDYLAHPDSARGVA